LQRAIGLQSKTDVFETPRSSGILLCFFHAENLLLLIESMLVRVLSRQAAARGVVAIRPTMSVTRSFSDDAEEMDPKAIQKIVDAKITKANQTITPWFAREDISMAMKVKPVENLEEVSAIQFLPEVIKQRKVRIFKPTRSAMQSATHKFKNWQLSFDNQERWINPLTGWTSTGDPLSNQQLRFETPEQAIEFAKKQGWDYSVDEQREKANYRGRKDYSYNFLPVDVTNHLKREGVKARHHFEIKDTQYQSCWQKTLSYHGERPLAQHGGNYDYAKKETVGTGHTVDPGTSGSLPSEENC